jgi:hypothetical protein
VLRRRWASTPRSERQSTRSSEVEQDNVLRPDVVGESRFRHDSNLSAVERQKHERHRTFSVKQDSSGRRAAMDLPAWAIAPASPQGPASDDDTGGGGDECLPGRLSYLQQFDADDDDDESYDDDCDDHEFELETEPQPRPGKTKARAKWSSTIAAAPGALVLGSGKRKQAAGQRNNGGAGNSKRPKQRPCRFDGGCDKTIRSNGLCIAHGGGKRCQHAGGWVWQECCTLNFLLHCPRRGQPMSACGWV